MGKIGDNSTFGEWVAYEFFSIAQANELRQGMMVRVKRVVITLSIISDFFEIKEPNVDRFDARAEEITIPMLNFLKFRRYRNPRCGSTVIQYGELDPDPAFMLN